MINVPIPTTLGGDLIRFLRDLVGALNKDLLSRPSSTTPVGSVLLVSPGKKVYSVGVADDGTLTSTLVSE